MSKEKKSFLNGAFILAVAGLICKIIGAVYRIPLRNIIGEEAMGVYSAVYPIYTFLLIFSTSGIPTAISKLVAQERSKGNYSGAHNIFLSSLKMLFAIGGITTLLMLAGSSVIANVLNIDSWQPIAAISLSLFFVSLLSAFRGYYQGLQNMTPTAVTQLIEQLVKLAAGFFFAISWYKKYGYVMAAAGALLGITISELVAFLFILVMYFKDKKKLFTFEHTSYKSAGTMRSLLAIAIPMTIGGAIKPLVDAIDSIMVKNILQNDLGYTSSYVDALYGFLKSDCGTLINMPTVLTVALSMALVPAISASLAAKNKHEVDKISRTGLKLSIVFSLPCTVGFLTLSQQILSLLYTYETKTYGSIVFTAQEKLSQTGNFLMILSIGIVFLAIVQTCAGILQGIGKVTLPVINLAIGMAVKILLNLTIVPNERINIYGVPIGTVTCYAIAAILDIFCVIHFTKTRFDFKEILLRPLLACALMTAAIFALKAVLPSGTSKLITICIILVAAAAYFAGIVIFKVFDKNDIALMPGGAKIEKLFAKLGIKIRSGEQ